MFLLANRSTRNELREKIVFDYQMLKHYIEACRTLRAKIVLTVGTWDMLHIGHARYLFEAKRLGDVLVVGVDTDAAVKRYKGEYRPIIPQDERMEMLTYLEFVNFVTIIDDVDMNGRWKYALARLLRPDVFVAVEDSYPPRQQDDLKRFCGELVVLPRQAEQTSSSNIVQNILKGQLLHILGILEKRS